MSPTIADLDLFLVEKRDRGREHPIRSLLVRLVAEGGLEGWGESQTTWHAPELPARRYALLSVLANRSIFDVEELLGLPVLRTASIRCAVEMASWDLIGRAAGQPLCNLFGGTYRRRVPLAVRLHGKTPDEIVVVARDLCQQGFHTQIVPSSGNVHRDLETLHGVRDSVGDRVALSFDAAAAFDMENARELCAEIESASLRAVLDPLDTRNLDQVASLRRQTSVPLCAWRAIRSPADMLAVIRCGAAGEAVVDLQLVGGIAQARRCGAIAQAAAMPTALCAGQSLGIGLAAMLQLACALPVFAECNECARLHLQDDILVESVEIVDGTATTPVGPGLGVEVDRAKLEKHQILH